MHISRNFITQSCHIFKKDKNGCSIFDFFLIRSVQNGSNLIKLDFSPIKNATIKSCHKQDNIGCFVFDFFGSENGSKSTIATQKSDRVKSYRKIINLQTFWWWCLVPHCLDITTQQKEPDKLLQIQQYMHPIIRSQLHLY